MELKIPTTPDILGIAISNRSLDSHESCVDNHSGTLGCVVQNSKEKIVSFLTKSQRQNEHVHRNSEYVSSKDRIHNPPINKK